MLASDAYARQRLVVSLRHRRGMTWRAIGAALGVSGNRARELYVAGTWPTDREHRARRAFANRRA